MSNTKTSGAIENFLRRWSTVDITQDNAFLFDEHLLGVSVLANKKERKLLEGLNRHTSRKEFAERYKKLLEA